MLAESTERLNFLDKVLQSRFQRHALFWLLVLFAAPFFAEFTDLSRSQSIIYRAVGLPIKMAAAYLLVYYQIPQFLQKKRYFQAILSFLISTVVFCFIYRINNIYIAETLAGSDAPKESITEIFFQYKTTVSFYFWRVYLYPLLFLFLKIIKDWAEEKHQVERLKKEKATTELNFLKAQIHPHFLFNTLNNLYALAVKKSDDTADGIAKLSEMLDYMLYQCNEEKVFVTREIELIQDYIDLELLRYGKRLKLNFDHRIDAPSAKISPLVLLSIVENAFKHGVSEALHDPIVDIELLVENGQLDFKVYNTKAIQNVKQENEYRIELFKPNKEYRAENHKKGIGINNIKRQLELVYPEKYEWRVNEKMNSYEVVLKVDLS